MTTAVDYILEGLAKYLELEREDGVRAIPFDSGFLAELKTAGGMKSEGRCVPLTEASAVAAPVAPIRNGDRRGLSAPAVSPEPAASVSRELPAESSGAEETLPFVFLHHVALKPSGIEMMAKIIAAMKATPERAPIIFTGKRPPARIYVVLGALALKKWFPGKTGVPGGWIKGDGGEDALITYSPEFLLRFGAAETPGLKQLKKNMWTSLKGVLQRLG